MKGQKLGFLNSLLCKWQREATIIGMILYIRFLPLQIVCLGINVSYSGDPFHTGKTVLPVLLLVRLVILGAAVHTCWQRDADEFMCNTRMPGCDVSCYSDLTPLAAPRLWTLQVKT